MLGKQFIHCPQARAHDEWFRGRDKWGDLPIWNKPIAGKGKFRSGYENRHFSYQIDGGNARGSIFLVYLYLFTSKTASMTLQQELSSWNPFQKSQHEVKSVPEVGSVAPSTPQIKLPRNDKKSTIIVFLRHCGCPCKCFRYDLSCCY